MKVVGITGGTGFLGTRISRQLAARGYEVIIFTRHIPGEANPHVTYAQWDPAEKKCDKNALAKIDAMIHLAGAGVADKRWTEARKKEIVASRTISTAFLAEQLMQYAPACKVLVSASAIGYYGADKDGQMPFTEDMPPANDFLARTCQLWEDASLPVATSMRRVIIRIGIVLGRESGAFPEFERPMKLGVVPILGSGRQMTSWIEVDDLASLFIHAVENEQMAGVYNGVAPAPVDHKTLMLHIARQKGGLKIPVPVPAFALKILLGEMSIEILKSCTVSSAKVQGTGFTFKHPNIDGAIRYILTK